MAERMQKPGRSSRNSGSLPAQAAALTVLFIGGLFIVGGLQLSSASGRFPVMLGGTTAALALLEFLSATFSKAPVGGEPVSGRVDWDETKAIAWIFLTILAIYVLGILLGAFVSTVVFCRFIERRKLLLSVAISASNVFVIWFAFSFLAKFTLYRGVIF